MSRQELVRSVYTVTARPLHAVGDGKRKTASESIWYVLATIAGEPEKTRDPAATIKRNRELWNGFMTERFASGITSAMRLEPGFHVRPLSSLEQRYMREALDTRGFRGVPIPREDDPIDFSYVDFHDPIWFDGFVFSGPTTFKGAKFGGHSHSFEGAIFAQEVIFEDAECSGVFFCPDTVFGDSAHFDGAKFHSGASFSRCAFHADVGFDEAQFVDDANFDNCKFTGSAGFSGAVFEEGGSFGSAEFQTSALFQRVSFNSDVPWFVDSTLPEYTVWHDAKWPPVPDDLDDALSHIQRYQRLALLMNHLEKFDDQRMFVREEMRTRRRVENRLVGFANHAYELICEYGWGLKRISAIWAGHMALGATLLFVPKLTATLNGGTEPGWQVAKALFVDFLLALVLSFTNAHGPLALYRTFFESTLKDWPWLIWVGPLQTVLGVIILFFLLLTIRNRFRMR